MRLHIVRLFPLLAAACVAPLVDDPADPGTTSGSTGTPDDATTVPLPPSPGSTTDPGGASISTSDDPDASASAGSSTGEGGGLGEGEECELQLQGCAPGLKCMPYSADGSGAFWDASACFPIAPDPAGLGEECEWIGQPWSGYDTCGWGQVCWGFDGEAGECRGLCLTDDPKSWDIETWTCEDPLAIPTVGCQSCFCTCDVPCDPLDQNCDEGQECMPVADFFECVPDASGDAGAYGDPCEFVNVCDPGLVCVDPSAVPPGQACEGAAGCCTPLCDVTAPNTCPGEGQTCQRWYEEGNAPMGLENVGACSLPP